MADQSHFGHAFPQSGRRPDYMAVIACFFFIAAVGATLFYALQGHFQYHIWSDRDLLRADVSLFDLPPYGTELEGTSKIRTPGGAYYYLLSILRSFGLSPTGIWLFAASMTVSSAVLVMLFCTRYLSFLAGMIFAALFLTLTTAHDAAYQLWNPAFPLPLGLGALFFLFLTVKHRTGRYLWPMVLLIGLAGQIHISYLVLLVVAAITLAWCRVKPGFGWLLLALAALAAAYLPYLVVHGPELPSIMTHLVAEKIKSGAGTFSLRKVLDFLQAHLWRVAGFIDIGYQNIYSDDPALFRSGLRYFALYAIVTAAKVTVAASFVAGIIMAVRPVRVGTGWSFAGGEAAFANFHLLARIFAVYTGVLVLGGADGTLRYNYLLTTVSLLIACYALSHFIAGCLSGRAWTSRVTLTLLLGGVAVGAIYPPYANYRERTDPSSVISYHRLAERIRFARDGLGISAAELRHGVALVAYSHEAAGFEFVPNATDEGKSFDYLINKEEAISGSTSGTGRCVAIILDAQRQKFDSRESAVSVVRRSLPERGSLRVLDARLFKGDHFVVYEAAEGNCLHTYANAYWISPADRKIAAVEDRLKPGTGIGLGGGEVAFKVDGGQLHYSYLLSFVNTPAGSRAILSGSGSRGYTGYPVHAIGRLRVEISDPVSERRTTYEFSDRNIGDRVLGPLKSLPGLPLAQGNYDVDIHLSDFRTGGNIRFLSQEISVPRGLEFP